MKLNPIIHTVTPDAAFYLGMVMSAHNNRAFCRMKAITASGEKKDARKDLSEFGSFEDCGPSYESMHEEARGRFNEAVKAKVAAEKYYKKTKSDFITSFPQYTNVLEAMMPGSTQEHKDAA